MKRHTLLNSFSTPLSLAPALKNNDFYYCISCFKNQQIKSSRALFAVFKAIPDTLWFSKTGAFLFSQVFSILCVLLSVELECAVRSLIILLLEVKYFYVHANYLHINKKKKNITKNRIIYNACFKGVYSSRPALCEQLIIFKSFRSERLQ